MSDFLSPTAANNLIQASYFLAAVLFIIGLKRMSSPVTARAGIIWAGLGMLLATIVTFAWDCMSNFALILAAIGVGGTLVEIDTESAKIVDVTALRVGTKSAALAIAWPRIRTRRFDRTTFTVVETPFSEAKEKAERATRNLENQYRVGAVVTAPIPAILLGLIMLCWRVSSERREIKPDRLVR